MREPGGLDELDDAGRAAWGEIVAECLQTAISTTPTPYLLPAPDARTPFLTGPDWTGLPSRVVSCLSRARALGLLDRERRAQEDYLEWRTVRAPGGRIKRVELTTELRDYWRVLAAHRPARTIELVGELTGVAAGARQIYGVADPARLSPEALRIAFEAAMIAHPNSLNDGRRGICFMSHPDNDLRSLVKLATAAARPCVVRDPPDRTWRPSTASETISLLHGAAVPGRASDPVLVERLGRLAFERRLIAIAEPVGVYIRGVEHTRLRTPNGSPVAPEWFAPGRGVSAQESPDGHPRCQRLVFEVPRSEGFDVSGLTDAATERPIRHGAQVAELVKLGIFLRISEAGVVRSSERLEARPGAGRATPCGDLRPLVMER